MLSNRTLFFEIQQSKTNFYKINDFNLIPKDIFLKAIEKSNGEYTNMNEYLAWANNEIYHLRQYSQLNFNKKFLLFTYGNGDFCIYDAIKKTLLDYNHETDRFEKSQTKF